MMKSKAKEGKPESWRFIAKLAEMTDGELIELHGKLKAETEKKVNQKDWYIPERKMLLVAMELTDRGYTSHTKTEWRKA